MKAVSCSASWGVALLVADGVHAVPQGHLLDVEPVHAKALLSEIHSAVAMAAEVMMSRFPA